ncbi:UNVERIFIED_CONTAM: hypothetical protein K2H54_002864 [Gekko kuhli]
MLCRLLLFGKRQDASTSLLFRSDVQCGMRHLSLARQGVSYTCTVLQWLGSYSSLCLGMPERPAFALRSVPSKRHPRRPLEELHTDSCATEEIRADRLCLSHAVALKRERVGASLPCLISLT